MIRNIIRDKVNNEYFEWLYELACSGRFSKEISYRKILTLLHSTKFRYSIPKDANRAEDGVSLRYRFVKESNYDERMAHYINGPCSVLEMMLGLAVRCEEQIMDNPDIGDRTRQWFWGMINNLGLGGMYDDIFDKAATTEIVRKLLDREYEPNVKGGLFTIKYTNDDLRDVEIWNQLCWYLDKIIS